MRTRTPDTPNHCLVPLHEHHRSRVELQLQSAGARGARRPDPRLRRPHQYARQHRRGGQPPDVRRDQDQSRERREGASTHPGTWVFLYENTTTPGEVDFVLTDDGQNGGGPGNSAATLSPPPTAKEIVKLTFNRIDGGCTSVALGFNAAAPVTGAEIAAFPPSE